MINSIELSEMQRVQLLALDAAGITHVKFLQGHKIALLVGRNQKGVYTITNEFDKWQELENKLGYEICDLKDIIKKYS